MVQHPVRQLAGPERHRADARQIYLLTKQVAGLFGGKNGNYGIAIILLTMMVRMMMFPLGRKQALMAKRMQDLQP